MADASLEPAVTQLTEAVYLRRLKTFRAELAEARERYTGASHAAATGTGTDEAQREAQTEVTRIEDKISGLDAARREQVRQDEQAERDAELRRWEETAAEARRVAEEMESIADELDPVREQIEEAVSKYAEALSAMRELCRRHKLNTTGMLVGDGRAEPLRHLNGGRSAEKARDAVKALSTLQGLLHSLGHDADAALAVLHPEAFSRKYAA
jgi:DNA repair exonuclease SbcCD ATPase subunit